MKIHTILTSQWRHRRHDYQGSVPPMNPVLALMLVAGSLVVAAPARVSAQPPSLLLAQAMDVPPAPTFLGSSGSPIPGATTYNTAAVPASQQYVVYVPSADPMLLDQVRGLAPDAFATYYQGQSVIQVGRFNYYQNAQQQVSTLAAQGIGAQISEAAPAIPQYGQMPSPSPSVISSYSSAPSSYAPAPNSYINSGDLPPLPVVAVPQGSAPPAQVASNQGVTFGQPAGVYPSVPGTTTYAPGVSGEMPLPPSSAPTVAAAPVANSGGGAPYYVVIPAPTRDLPAISSQVIQLGTPADRVQQRQEPLGPNVAVGPFRDRGLAERWNSYFRDAGIPASRVVYEP